MRFRNLGDNPACGPLIIQSQQLIKAMGLPTSSAGMAAAAALPGIQQQIASMGCGTPSVSTAGGSLPESNNKAKLMIAGAVLLTLVCVITRLS